MLQVTDLYKSFPGQSFPILNGISLTLEKGDFCIIIGSNGSGKSTFLKTILGEYPPDTGNIVLNGKNISRLPLYQRAENISCVFQDVLRGTISEMTVTENLSLAQMRGRPARFKSYRQYRPLFQQHLALLNMGLENHLDTLCGLLSGGQRQAVAFAMATMHSPDLLLLDEHCSALDPKSSQHIMESTAELIKRLQITTLMVTHNLRDALKYGNKLLMLHQGKIVLNASQSEKQQMTMEYLLQLFHRHEDLLLAGES